MSVVRSYNHRSACQQPRSPQLLVSSDSSLSPVTGLYHWANMQVALELCICMLLIQPYHWIPLPYIHSKILQPQKSTLWLRPPQFFAGPVLPCNQFCHYTDNVARLYSWVCVDHWLWSPLLSILIHSHRILKTAEYFKVLVASANHKTDKGQCSYQCCGHQQPEQKRNHEFGHRGATCPWIWGPSPLYLGTH